MIHRALVAIVLVTLLSACNGELSLEVDGRDRHYLLHVPKTLEESPALLLALHQFSDTAAGMRDMTQFNELADEKGFIVAYPSGAWRVWNTEGKDGDADVAFLLALIDELVAEQDVDPARIFVTGASAGAIMAQYFITRTEQIAAIAPVMGSLTKEQTETWKPLRKLPVLLVHGVEDPVIPYAGGETYAGPGRSTVFMGAEENAGWWAAKNDCGEATGSEPAAQVSLFSYDCEAGAPVQFYRIAGGGHTWPGGTNRFPGFIVGPLSNALDASRTIWTFFEAHPLAAN